jgi:hypothetical protein
MPATEVIGSTESLDELVVDLDETAAAIQTPFSITSYGADYPVDGLVRRLETGDVAVPLFTAAPVDGQTTVGFQRQFVWRKYQADRFIESLLLGLPVPSIFLVKEPNGKLLVLDGQQRLLTLQAFYSTVFQGSEFILKDVQPRWQGKTYKTLHPDDRRRLDNSTIHAIVVRQDEPTDDQSSIYLIFERLNSGGTILQPQEIRIALYHGAFAALLAELNADSDWRTLYGRKSSRLKDLELMLRFFALYYAPKSYKRPMKDFLNKFMARNRLLGVRSAAELRLLFTSCVSAIAAGIGASAFRPFGSALNAAVLDSVMVGVATRLQAGPIDPESLRRQFDGLLQDEQYRLAVSESTADEDRVRRRLEIATKFFASAT